MKEKTLAMLASYGRSILASALTLYLAGVTDPVDLLWSLLASVIPVAIRFLNPKDEAFGIVPKEADVLEAISNATPEVSPIKLKSTKK